MLIAAEILIWLGVWTFVENVFMFFDVKLYGRLVLSLVFFFSGYYLYKKFNNSNGRNEKVSK